MPAIAAPPAPIAASSPAQTQAPPSKPSTLDVDLYSSEGEIDALDEGGAPPADKGEQTTPKPAKEAQEPAGDTTDAEIDALDVIENPDANPKPKPKPDAEDDEDEPAPKDKDAKPGEQEEQLPTRARDLKVVYEKVKAEKKTLEADLAKATQEIAKLRSTGPEESAVLSEKLTKSEARRNELESEIRHLNYTKSEEYLTRYDKPNREAWQKAAADLSQLQVETEDGTMRSASVNDLVTLANMPLGEAWKAAKVMFGDVAGEVMAHRRVVQELATKQETAIAESRKSAEERDKTRSIEQRQHQEKYSKLWVSENENLSKQYPKWFGPIPDDTEGNAMFERGLKEVDAAFNDPNLTTEERISATVKVRNKAANHDRLALRLKRAAVKLKKYREELEAFKRSSPPGGKTTARRAGGDSLSVYDEANSEIDALDENER